MEPLFSSLLFLGPFFAPLIIRVGLTIVFVWEAKRLASSASLFTRVRALYALVLAILLGVGFLTQLGALLGMGYILFSSVTRAKSQSLFNVTPTSILAFVMLFTLLLTGAGYTPFPFGDVPY
jgi:hypothetical protein